MFVETKEVGEVQQAPAKTLKLSEAMRIGARLTSWMGRGPYISDDGKRTCAWGAAAIGMGGDRRLAGSLHCRSEGGKAGEDFFAKYRTTIMSANDNGAMSREQIADALEALGY